ncbi:MAG: L-lactate transporter [Chroococcidiopsis sp. SAG 2025]|uniref:L-lactate MFS transporter n=1 Tax=Chroococcidiopsis sp. SAG 2025 TaxID=171389 RepID=UPI0029370A10|nr:OFA family MFS transporter [Chroococcidiopsis sp. SAG 2025]MDV2994251.1 L-lactate transporter [Chroococcidiopsis sp. SAG 2025]
MDTIKLFGMPAQRGRWLLIPLGIVVLLCLGTVYSWSIFRKPLEKLLNIGATESLLPFTVLLVVFALLMPIAGFLIDRFGSRVVTAVGGVVMGVGYILTSFATNEPMLVFAYGLVAGAGIGIAYGVPLAVSAKWFPDKKGIAVGLTVIGFGLSPLITAPLAKNLIDAYGVRQTFTILGIAFSVIVVAIATQLKMPPPEWQPITGSTAPAARITTARTTTEKIWQTQSFYGLWICYTIGTFVGLSAIGISSPVAQEIIKLDSTTAAMTVSLFAIFNGLGRPLFGWVTDRFNPKIAAIAVYAIVLMASILMLNARTGDTFTYILAFALFWLSLGGWLAIAPIATLTLFRSENYAKNYGIVFTAYGVGAFFGTIIAGRIRDIFGSYTYAFYPMAGLALAGTIVAVFFLKRLPAMPEILEEPVARS